MRTTFIALVAGAFLLTHAAPVAAVPKKPVLAKKPFVRTDLGFSLRVPKGWKELPLGEFEEIFTFVEMRAFFFVDPQLYGKLVARQEVLDGTVKQPIIAIIVSPPQKKGASLAAEVAEQKKSMQKDKAKVTRDENITISGVAARALDFIAPKDGMQGRSVYALLNGTMYVFAVQSPVAQWNMYEKLFVRVLQSAQFIRSAKRTTSRSISLTGVHWHITLTIRIHGRDEVIPASIGLGSTHAPMHTHDTDGVIHLERDGKVTTDDTRLKNFFTIWGKRFNRQCIIDSCTGSNGTVQFRVNGHVNTAFEQYAMKDQDQIEIVYE